MNTINKILVVVLVFSMTLSMGCIGGNEITGYTLDIGFRGGSHETYTNIEGYSIISDGIFSDTVELYPVYGETITLHYVTSIDVR